MPSNDNSGRPKCPRIDTNWAELKEAWDGLADFVDEYVIGTGGGGIGGFNVEAGRGLNMITDGRRAAYELLEDAFAPSDVYPFKVDRGPVVDSTQTVIVWEGELIYVQNSPALIYYQAGGTRKLSDTTESVGPSSGRHPVGVGKDFVYLVWNDSPTPLISPLADVQVTTDTSLVGASDYSLKLAQLIYDDDDKLIRIEQYIHDAAYFPYGADLPCWLKSKSYEAPEGEEETYEPPFPAREGTYAAWLGKGESDFASPEACELSQLEILTFSDNHVFRFLTGSGDSEDPDGFFLGTQQEYSPEGDPLESFGYMYNLAYAKGLASIYTKDAENYLGLRVLATEESEVGSTTGETTIYGYSDAALPFMVFSGQSKFTPAEATGPDAPPPTDPPNFGELISGLMVWGQPEDSPYVFHQIGASLFGPNCYGFSKAGDTEYYHLLRSYAQIETTEVPGAALQLFNAGSYDYLEAFVMDDSSSLYGYSDQGAWNFALYAAKIGGLTSEAVELRMWDDLSKDYHATFVVDDRSETWGYSNNEAYTYAMGANSTANNAFWKLFNTASSQYMEGIVSNAKTNIFGYCDNEAWNFALEASFSEAFMRLFDSANAQYLEAIVDAIDSNLYGYADNGTYNWRLGGFSGGGTPNTSMTLWNADESIYFDARLTAGQSAMWGYSASETWNYQGIANTSGGYAKLRVFDGAGNSYVEQSIKSTEATVYGFSNAAWEFLIKSTSTESHLELYRTGADGYAELYAYNANAGVSVSNGASIFSTLEPSSLVLHETSNQTNLWAEGLTITDGSITIALQLSAANGKDIALREVEVCGGKRMMVLCSEEYDP